MTTRKKSTTKQYTIMLTPEFVEEIDKEAEKRKITRGQVMRDMLEERLENVRKETIDIAEYPPELIARLDRLANKGELTRSRLIQNMIEVTIDCLETTEKVGILQFSIIIRDLHDKMKAWAKNTKEKNSLKEFIKQQ